MEAVQIVDELVPSAAHAAAQDEMVGAEPGVELGLEVERLERVGDEGEAAAIIVIIGLDLQRTVLGEAAGPARQQVVAAVAVAGEQVDVGVEDVALQCEMIAPLAGIGPEAGLPA